MCILFANEYLTSMTIEYIVVYARCSITPANKKKKIETNARMTFGIIEDTNIIRS